MSEFFEGVIEQAVQLCSDGVDWSAGVHVGHVFLTEQAGDVAELLFVHDGDCADWPATLTASRNVHDAPPFRFA
jgi:hypothetical protein